LAAGASTRLKAMNWAFGGGDATAAEAHRDGQAHDPGRPGHRTCRGGGRRDARDLADRAGFGGATWTAPTVLRWPIAFAVLLFAIGACSLRLMPRPPWRWSRRRDGLRVAWLAVTYGFGLYVSRLGASTPPTAPWRGHRADALALPLGAHLVCAAELTALLAGLVPTFSARTVSRSACRRGRLRRDLGGLVA
jgi:hypothetical protein